MYTTSENANQSRPLRFAAVAGAALLLASCTLVADF